MPSKSVEDNMRLRRFDLVKTMYVSDRVIAANKKDKTFNWFFEQFGNYQNVKSCENYKLLWKTLYDILSAEKENCSMSKIFIKSNAVVHFLEAVENYPYSEPWASVILSSITKFLQTPTVNAALIADIDILIMLLIATVKVICKTYELNCDDVQSQNEAICLASAIVDILENLPSSNEEDKALLLSNSLQDLAIFMYLADSHKELESLSDKLVKKITSIVFNLKNKQYETLLSSGVKEDAVEPPNKSLFQFFASLHDLLNSEEVIFQSISETVACASLMKKLLENFLLQNKSSLPSLKVMSLLFTVAGLDIRILIDSSSSCNSVFFEKMCQNIDVNILGVCHLLEACSAVPQYFTVTLVPDGYYRPSIWVKGVATALLGVKVSRNKSLWLKCFHLLLKMSPTILEDDIVTLIKKAHLNISVHSTESKKQYCELFDTILQAYSQLHQMPKFFVKLLLALTECIKENTGGKFLTNGQLLPSVEESIAKYVQELPYGQMIELWKIFIETFSTLVNMSQSFETDKCYMFYAAQIFSTFLVNIQLFQANVPLNMYSQFSGLIELTSKEIRRNISVLEERNSKVVPLQRSLLLLCYAIGEVKLAYKVYYEKPVDMPEAELSKLDFDFSVVHSFLNRDYAMALECFLSGDDKILAALVFQLLLQKVKAVLSLFEESSFVEEVYMKSIIFIIIHHLETCCVTPTAAWDMDLYTINEKNYGTVIWKMLFKMMPLMLGLLSPKSLTAVSLAAINVILQDNSSDNDAKSFLLVSLKCEFYQESKQLQTSVASILWNREKILRCKKRSYGDSEVEESAVDKIFSLLDSFSSKSLKYAQRTPKSDKSLGSMWTQIKEISDILNKILLSESLSKDKLNIDRTYDLLQLLKCLPLEYLLPGNQMKCIIGLSLLFFLVPQSCDSAQAENLAKEIALVMISIFNGVRSIWLFDFVTSGPYLKFVVKTLEAVIHAGSCDNFDWAIQLVEHLISAIVKNTKSLEAMEQYISELSTKKKCNRSTLIAFYALLKKLSQVPPQKQEKHKEALQRLSLLSCTSFVKFCKQVNFEDTDHFLFIKCYMYVMEIVCSTEVGADFKKECLDFLPVILGIAMEKITDLNTDDLSDVHLLFLSKVCKYSSAVSSFLPWNFVCKLWNILIPYFQEKAKKRMKSDVDDNLTNTPACNQFDVLDTDTCSLCLTRKCNTFIENSSEPTKSVPDKTMSPLSLNESEEESIRELCAITSDQVLSEVFQDLLKQIGCFDSTALDMLLVLKSIINAIKEKSQNILNQHLQKCLSYLYSVMHRTCNSPTCQAMIQIPIMDFISFILRRNRGLPKQLLLQSLQCVSFVELYNFDDYKLYTKLFSAAWGIVYNLFMHHTALVLTACAPFLVHVGKLLRSITKAGRDEPLMKCNPETFQQVQLCAQDMNRLLTVITRNKTEFAKLVPCLVTEFVDTVKDITLEPTIKDILLSGVHRILDICNDHTIKMLAVNINYIGREIYANLIKNYQQNKYIGSA